MLESCSRSFRLILLLFVLVPEAATQSPPRTWCQVPGGSTTAALVHAALAFDELRQMTVLFGGHIRGVGAQQQTMLFDGTRWRNAPTTTSPPTPRDSHAMAYDRRRGRVVLFGGSDGNPLGDTWEWDGTNWTPMAPTTSPKARYLAAMAFDETRQRVVLFGGTTNGDAKADFWEWDGVTWTAIKPLGPQPAGRYRHMLVSDTKRQRLVLFGGLDANSNHLGDTWEWDGSAWALQSPATRPSARHTAAMAYHAALGRTVLFGGSTATNVLRDTWEWDGSAWHSQAPFLVPGARSGSAVAYDVARARIVLNGGETSAPVGYADTWEYQPGAPNTFPTGAEATDGNAALSVPFTLAQGRAQFLLMHSAFFCPIPGTVQAVEFRRDQGTAQHPARTIDTDVFIGVAATTAATMSMEMAKNFQGTPSRIFTGRLSLPSNPPIVPGPAPFTIRIPASAATFTWKLEDLVLEIVIRSNSLPGIGTYEIDAVSTPRASGSASSFGIGCSGQAGAPRTVVYAPQYLHPGGFLVTHAVGLKPGTFAISYLGTSTSQWAGLPLPYTFPGTACTLYTGVEHARHTFADATGAALMLWLLPSDPILANGVLYLQWLAPEPPNAYPPLVLSQASKLTLALQQASFDTIGNSDLGPFGLKDPSAHVGPVLRLVIP